MSTTPTVYFIDDSATMREVIKIAFRRENINVVACPSGVTALSQMEQTVPDVVISDVIMPEKDGYQVCESVKQNPRFARVPVILMSGVVNRAVAEKAFAVKANELIRKPFQPQDLIARVRHLLQPKPATPSPTSSATVASANAALSSIFQTPVTAAPGRPSRTTVAVAQAPRNGPGSEEDPLRESRATPPAPSILAAAPSTPADPPTRPPAVPAGPPVSAANVPSKATTASVAADSTPLAQPHPPIAKRNGIGDLSKLKIEILRLQGLVRKLQSELQAEREYSTALEEHIKTLQEVD